MVFNWLGGVGDELASELWRDHSVEFGESVLEIARDIYTASLGAVPGRRDPVLLRVGDTGGRGSAVGWRALRLSATPEHGGSREFQEEYDHSEVRNHG
jgi:hypothetical protein